MARPSDLPTSHHMKLSTTRLLICTFSTLLLLSGCAHDARTEGVERRQDRMDSRTGARQDRWAARGEHQDARARGTLESW